jgi:hypothetical protein
MASSLTLSTRLASDTAVAHVNVAMNLGDHKPALAFELERVAFKVWPRSHLPVARASLLAPIICALCAQDLLSTLRDLEQAMDVA